MKLSFSFRNRINMIIYKFFKNILLVQILILISFSCSKPAYNFNKRWEGIKYNKLRIYVKYEINEDIDNKNIKNKIFKKLNVMAKKRAIHLITNYLIIKKTNPSLMSNIKKIVPNIIENCKTISYSCDEDFCETLVDFNIIQLNKILKIKK